MQQGWKQTDIAALGKLAAGDADQLVGPAQELGSAPVQRPRGLSVHAGAFISTRPPFIYWK